MTARDDRPHLRTAQAARPADDEVVADAHRRDAAGGCRRPGDLPRQGEFWDGLIAANLEMLRSEGIANFKRTVCSNYYNWLVTSLRDRRFGMRW